MPLLLRFLVAGLVLAGALAGAPVWADDYDDAVKLHAQGDAAAALARVERFLSAHPRDSRARFLQGVILTEQGNTAEAIAVYRSLTEDFPELPEPHNNLAVLYAREGNYDEARRSLEMAIRAYPDYAIAHENLGDVYAALARQAYEKAAQLEGDRGAARAKLSLIRELLSSGPSAVAAATPPRAPAAAAPAAAPVPPQTATPATSPAPTTAATPPADPTRAALDLVAAWAQAWSGQDVDAYLALYSPNFRRPKNQTREQWEASRRARLERPKHIRVEVIDPKVTLDGSDRATVTFRQKYTTDSYKSSGRKTLQLVRQGERWLIEQEIFTTR